jgi:hypothetical protein
MKKLFIPLLISVLLLSCNQSSEKNPETMFENQILEYFKKFPYQDTYNYMLRYTSGDATQLNKIFAGSKPELVKAGEDKVVRMNNDTYYSGGFVYLAEGPVKLSASVYDENRFYSFQLMDDRNTNFRNIIRPKGEYYLFHGKKPNNVEGELIESPSKIVAVIIRVEVKDKNDPIDVEAAKKVFNGINISGPEITEFPVVDLLSSFDERVVVRANEMMDSVFANVPISQLVASPEQVPNEVSYLHLASGTKGGWGGPVTSHSAYETIFTDDNGRVLEGSKGIYSVTTTEPPVDAFWSVTVYDTERGGFLHPNAENKYHINNTTAVKNEDGTVTFLFKTKCGERDLNCLEVPAGQFDLVTRYYLAHEEIRSAEWTFPKLELLKK